MKRVSVIIPTIQRDTLNRAVESVLSQDLGPDQFEVIVINDAGFQLQQASWFSLPNVKILNTQHRERSVARNTGAAVATGTYLLFLDDDDWLLPHCLSFLLALIGKTEADMIIGGVIQVDRAGGKIREFYPDIDNGPFIKTMSGEWIPLLATLINSESFFQTGGFNPLLTGSEDLDLARRIAFFGRIIGNPKAVACISMGQTGSTTNWENHARQRKLAREIILDEKGVFHKLVNSARATFDHTNYWHGKILRIYLTSTLWNIQHGRLTTAFSRLCFGAVGLAVSMKHLFSKEFWRALLRPHKSFGYSK